MADERGRFIVLEGIDGAGTTTQAALLADALRARLGVEVELTREPTDGPLGRVLREALSGRAPLDPVALALAFAADRADHVHNPGPGSPPRSPPAAGSSATATCCRRWPTTAAASSRATG